MMESVSPYESEVDGASSTLQDVRHLFPEFPEEEKEQQDEGDWCFGLEENLDNITVASDLVDSLPPQLHPAVSLGMRRVSSAYFSLQGSCSEADLYSLSSEYHGGEDHAGNVDADWLYHDIIMHVFTYLDAKSLAAFSETARRSNFECFYFLQLQLQRALLGDDPQTCLGNWIKQKQDDRLAAIAGSWSVSRLASLDKEEASSAVQEYLDSNSTLRTMPLSHSLAYIRQVLRRNGFPSHSQEAPALAKAAMLVTLVGAATIMTGNVNAEVVDSFGTELPNMLFKVGFVGGLVNAARWGWEEKRSSDNSSVIPGFDESAALQASQRAAPPTMRETAGQMARTMQEFPVHLFQHVGMAMAKCADMEKTNGDYKGGDASISRRMYEAFRFGVSGKPLTAVENAAKESTDEAPRTPNPYEHLPYETSQNMADSGYHSFLENHEEAKKKSYSECGACNMETDGGKVPRKTPTGCVGAYFRAVRRATNNVTRLVKEQRRARFEGLPDKEDVARSFIDACCSDETLPIVIDLVQRQGIIDAGGFFCGSDGTETCALHASAFHGATRVLEFLCGGIDERHPSKDQGLCSVDMQDQNGWTALHFAAGANCVESVRILGDRGAKLAVTAENGYTPLQWAQRLSNHEVADELRKRLEKSDPYFNSNHPWMSSQPLSVIASRFFAMIPAR